MFGNVYGDDRFMVRFWVWLLCEGKDDVHVQSYGVAWLSSMVTGVVSSRADG